MTREEAIKIIESNCSCSGSKLREACAMFIPELAMSDDERIRKSLAKFLTEIKEISESGRTSWAIRKEDAEMCKSFLDYLEKQKEQKPVNHSFTTWHRDVVYCAMCNKNLDEGLRCNLEKVYKIIKELVDQTPFTEEQKPVECIEFDNEFESQVSHLLASVLNGEYEYSEGFVKHAAQSLLGYAKNEIKSDGLDKIEILMKALQTTNAQIGELVEENYKLKEQKPEWSEEDRIMLNDIIRCLPSKSSAEFNQKRVNWLKSLPERFNLQPKQEWSEEDEERIDEIEFAVMQMNTKRDDTKNKCLDWLKSLRPQPHTVSTKDATKFGNLEYERGVKDGIQSEKSHQWKPSEEQIGALNYAYCELFKREDVGHNILGPLQELLDNLKKRM